MNYSILKSPIGDLLLLADDSALTGIYFAGRKHTPAVHKHGTLNAQHPVLRQGSKELQEYLTGKRKTFSVPLRLVGTDFQKKVWRQIARIPYGKTISYSELAKRAGAPKAVRAAGSSTGRNPLCIIIACHRVVGKNGDIGGYAGGLKNKRSLLQLEKIPAPPSR